MCGGVWGMCGGVWRGVERVGVVLTGIPGVCGGVYVGGMCVVFLSE